MMKYVLLCLLIYGSAVSPATSSKSHPVTTFLNAKWYRTPVCLEIAEYLFDESPSLYWDYVERLNSLKTPLYEIDSDSKLYKSAVRVAEDLIGATQIAMLKVSLAMHSMSPRVQAHFQIAQEVITHGDCNTKTFVTIGSRVACNLAELKKGIDKMEKSEEEIYSFDHVYPGTENNTIAAVLYSEIGSKEFKQFHEFLKKAVTEKSGKIKYISRHYIKDLPKNKVRLSGYGVELYLKSTEYKSQDDSPRVDDDVRDQQESDIEVDGFDFKKLKERFPKLTNSLNRFKISLLEKSDEIAPLKAWEFQELGLQAAQRVAEIQGEEALQILQFTAQNFPTQAKSLLHVEVSPDFRKEMKHNIDILGKYLNLQPPDAALFVNGLFFDADTLDVGSLLETLKTELRVLDGLYKLNIEGNVASELLGLDLSTSGAKEFAIDIRDTAVIWINDLENDAQYKRWPASVMDLMRPTFPGMLRNVRKNLFNLVLLVDPIKPEARGIIKLVESFVVHTAPVRLGFVFDSRNTGDLEEDYRAILCAINYMTQNRSAKEALSFLTDIFEATPTNESVKLKTIHTQMKKKYGSLTTAQIDEILGEDSDFDYGRQVSSEFLDRMGFATVSPQALMNGVPLQQSLMNSDDFEETILTEIMQQTPNIQKAVYKGELTDNDNVIDYLMNMPHIMPRLNPRILTTEDPIFLDLSGTPHNDLNNVNSLINLSVRDMTATLMSNIKYFNSKHTPEKVNGKSVHFLTIWIVTDLNTANGKEMLKNALLHMKSSGGLRVAFLPNVEGPSISDKQNLNRLVWAATQSLSGVDATNAALKWIDNAPKTSELPKEVRELLSATELHMKMLRVYCQRVLNIKAGQTAVISNGNIIGPLDDSELFTTDDFGLIERFSNHQYGDKIRKLLQGTDNTDLQVDSDSILKLITILVPRQQSRSRFAIPTELQDHHTVVKLPQKEANLPYFEIFAVVDPASRGAQKLAPILILLRSIINCNMRVVMSAVDKHSDMPVKNFYRFVIEPELQFTSEGKLRSGPYAKFTGVPASPLLTQNLQVPENWLVEVVRSVYDLDNIKLMDINGPVHSEYELEYLLLEGHCFDSTSGAPPRGLQFTLGTKDTPIIVDTIVMANLGYFQLKANPGAWLLKLRHGKSEDIYDVTNAEGPNTIHGSEGTRVIISSLRSHVLKIRVTKKPGQAQADLLADDTEPSTGIWDSITSSFSGSETQTVETINIFSVASGHLYERLLRIMMLSLLKHTKSPVKFWFLKNYLSPQFIDFLPHMAAEYHFQYELVQYKWPRWLHQQTEKQRIIWGYKILFLDVLFPLDVKKIIFVDADAIVRADMKELNELDLNGAPYAYTPFCDSRKEMEGFRFWKQGYWRNHLQHRKYHISALYVVDLKKFRKIAAGDRLRGQYQALSQDPNSLSNLDQDLPNNMIHQVAIKSLPQEWLWCQTWCSDDSFSSAKTIDLCNNPQTKEAKLMAAQRIIPEWTGYDSEIKNLLNRVEDGEVEHEETITGHDERKTDIHSEL